MLASEVELEKSLPTAGSMNVGQENVTLRALGFSSTAGSSAGGASSVTAGSSGAASSSGGGGVGVGAQAATTNAASRISTRNACPFRIRFMFSPPHVNSGVERSADGLGLLDTSPPYLTGRKVN